MFQFGLVEFFAVHRHCNTCNTILALVRKVQTVIETIVDCNHEEYPTCLGLKLGHIHVMELGKAPNLVVVEVYKIVSLLVGVNVGNFIYVCEFPNNKECD